MEIFQEMIPHNMQGLFCAELPIMQYYIYIYIYCLRQIIAHCSLNAINTRPTNREKGLENIETGI